MNDSMPTAEELILAPRPRALTAADGRFDLAGGGRRIVLEAPPEVGAGALLSAGRALQDGLAAYAPERWELDASAAGPPEAIGVVLRVDPGLAGVGESAQGYRLAIEPERVTVVGRSPAAVFHGVATLRQILVQTGVSGSSAGAGAGVPCLTIEDWPDLAVRGVMLDVSRDKVPTMQTVYALVDKLASWKYNQLQLYTEHTFAYRAHPTVWADASPFTGEEILALDRYCAERFVELVPNQNCFGHLHHWLEQPEYAHLAEVTGEFEVPWGTMHGPFSIAPVDPGSIELVRGMLDELLPHFASGQVNVGCDETFDVGFGRSKELADRVGAERVYLDFVLAIHREVSARGHVMQFWGDIIERHPELIPELPKDAIALAWGYDADHPFAELAPKYAAAGVPFYVCPGTSSWSSLGGLTTNALTNIAHAVEAGITNGARGILVTDWGDGGHWQALPVSYLGLLVGACYSWAYDANAGREGSGTSSGGGLDGSGSGTLDGSGASSGGGLDVAAAVSLHAFSDPSGESGRLAYELGEVYRTEGLGSGNLSVLFWLLQARLWNLPASGDPKQESGAGAQAAGMARIVRRMVEQHRDQLTEEGFRAAIAAVDAAMARLPRVRSSAVDADLVAAEFENTARLMRHGARRGLALVGAEPIDESYDRELTEIVRAYRENWLARNRPGGLADSVGRLEALHADYA